MSMFHSKSSDFTRGYLAALGGAISLSMAAILMRYLAIHYHVPVMVIAFWRDMLSVIIMIPLLAVVRPSLLKISPKHLFFLLMFGLLLAVFNILWTLSVDWNGAAIATVLVYSSATFSVLLGWWLLREELSLVKILAVFLCLGGCFLVSGVINTGELDANWPGIFTGILAGLCYAFYTLMGRFASQRGLNPWSTMVYSFAFASMFLLAANLMPLEFLPGKAAQPADLFWLGTAWAGWGILFLLAVFPTVAGFGLYLVSLSYLSPSISNLIVTAEPVFTTIQAYFLLGERLSFPQIVGSLLVVSGVVFLKVYESRTGRLTPAGSAEKARLGSTTGSSQKQTC